MGSGKGGVEEALGGSCRGGFESLLSSAIGLPLAVRASRCQRGAEGCAPCWASVPAPGIWLSVTQQLLTRPRAPYCVITATWHGFGPREPPTPTVRSRPPGSGWGGGLPLPQLCSAKWRLPSKHSASKAQEARCWHPEVPPPCSAGPNPSAAQSAGDLGLPGRRGEEVGAFAFKWDLYKICETQQS